MKNINVPVGISNFEKIRQDGYYYVDKTGLIKDMLENQIPEVTLITRPRRLKSREACLSEIQGSIVLIMNMMYQSPRRAAMGIIKKC